MKYREIKSKEETDSLIEFINNVASEQTKFITEDYFNHGINYAFGSYTIRDELIGAIRYCKQVIGKEQQCPTVIFNGNELVEAKINIFAIRPDYRNKGIGKTLQECVISHAKQNGCYQLASYSTYDKTANYAIKLKLGFCVQPEKQADGSIGCYFFIRL